MAVSNEQARSAASDGRNVVSCACSDIASWLTAAARELHHSLVPPVDLVLHAYKQDLKSKFVVLFLFCGWFCVVGKIKSVFQYD